MTGSVVLRDLDGVVVELGVDGGRWTGPSAAPDLDLSDLWCLSGLADAHAHLSQDELVLEPGDPEAIARRAFAYLEHGVFLCIDKGWCDTTVLTLLDRPPDERPDLEAAGRMIAGPGGYFSDFAVEVDDDELVETVRALSTESAGWVKLVGDWPRKGLGPRPNFSAEAMAAAVKVAHEAGARVAIHTMAPEVPSMAVAAGIDSIEHGLFLTEADVAALGQQGGAWVPTVVRMEAVMEQLGTDSSGGRMIAAGLDRVRALLPGAVTQGVTVLAGSDLAVPPGRIAAEAIRLADYGLEPASALASVSSAARGYCGIESGFEPGSPADVVAFDRNPAEDLSVLEDPQVVIRRARVIADSR